MPTHPSSTLLSCIARGAIALAALLALVAPPPAAAQSRIPVLMSTTLADDDTTGRSLVYAIKESLRGSRGFRLVEDESAWPYLSMRLVTVSTPGGGTAMAIAFVYDSVDMPMGGAYVTTTIQTCGRDRIAACAVSLMGSLDSAADRLRRGTKELWQTLH